MDDKGVVIPFTPRMYEFTVTFRCRPDHSIEGIALPEDFTQEEKDRMVRHLMDAYLLLTSHTDNPCSFIVRVHDDSTIWVCRNSGSLSAWSSREWAIRQLNQVKGMMIHSFKDEPGYEKTPHLGWRLLRMVRYRASQLLWRVRLDHGGE